MFPLLPRRTLLIGAAASTVAAALPARAAAAAAPIRAIGFDGFPIFDPRGVAARVKAIVGDKGEAFSAQWSAKLFGYSLSLIHI